MHSVFSKNREPLIARDAIVELFSRVVEQADHQRLRQANTSTVIARLFKRGLVTEALCAKTAKTMEMTAATSKARAAAMRRMRLLQQPSDTRARITLSRLIVTSYMARMSPYALWAYARQFGNFYEEPDECS